VIPPPARKRFGQHFLEPAWADKVVHAISPGPDDTIIEIGPGRGAITTRLAAHARVLAYEIDRDLAAMLRSTAPPALGIVERDFLEVGADEVRQELARGGPSGRLRVAGNLPYNVAAPILFRLIALFNAGLPIDDATLMLQREVADRLLARPGTKDYGVLTVLVRHQADVEPLLQLPPGAFRPPPKVRSTLLRLRLHAASPATADPEQLAALTKTVFMRRRKTLLNALRRFPAAARVPAREALLRAGVDPLRRPETLTIAELVGLVDAFASLRR